MVTSQRTSELRLLSVIILTALGDGFRYAALPLVLTLSGAQPILLGLLLAVGTAPFLVVGLFSGALVDRFDRVKLLQITELTRGIVVLGFALALLAHLPPQILIPLAFVVAAVMGIGESLTFPAVFSLTPTVVPSARLRLFNGRVASGQTVGRDLAGPLLGALMVSTLSAGPFLVNACTFLACWLLLFGLRQAAAPQPPATSDASLWADVRSGMTWMRRQPTLLRIAVASAIINLGNMGFLATESLFVIRELGAPASAYGVMMAAAAIGGSATGLIVDRLLSRVQKTTSALPFAALAVGAAMLGMGLAPNIVVAVAFSALSGAAFTVYVVTATTLRQEITPESWRGRADAMYRFIAWGALPVGSLAGGVLAESIGLRMPALATTCTCVLAALALWGTRSEGDPATTEVPVGSHEA